MVCSTITQTGLLGEPGARPNGFTDGRILDRFPCKLQCEAPRAEEERLEEQQKYGIYYQDDYDYLQHLRGPRTAVQEHSMPETLKKVSTVHEYLLKPATGNLYTAWQVHTSSFSSPRLPNFSLDGP